MRMIPRPVLLRVCAVACGLLCLWFRKAQSFIKPQMWAEDGSVFFGGAYLLGVESLFERYAGYYHTVPRLAAYLAQALAPALTPGIFAAACILGFVWVSWFITGRRVGLAYPYVLPALLAFAPVDGEAFLNLTNLQWTLAWLLVLVLIARPAHTLAQRVHDGFTVALVGLSGLFSVFFAPLFAIKALCERSRWSAVLLALNSVCAAIQAVGFSGVRRAPAVSDPLYADFWRVLGRPMFALINGPFAALDAESARLQSGLGMLTVATLVALTFLAWHRRNERALYLLAACFAVWGAVLVSISGNPSILLGGGPRYFFLQPVLLLTVLLCSGLVSRLTAACVGVAYVALVVANVESYRERPMRDLRWRRESACLETPPRAQTPMSSAAPRRCRIRLHPLGWYVDLPARN